VHGTRPPARPVRALRQALLQSTDVFGLGFVHPPGSTPLFYQSIPNQVTRIGFHAYLQAFVHAPGVNALPPCASNGIDWSPHVDV
jgi:hypothetical protein